MKMLGRFPAASRCSFALLSLLFAAPAVLAQSATWKPEKAIEIIVGTAPGAAPDKTARAIQRLWQLQGIYDGPVSVVNKPGGGNLIAWNYLNQHAGDGHYQMIGNLNVLISRAISVSSPQRLGAPLAAVPTWTEQGIKGTMTNFRAVIAPKGTGEAAVKFWESRYARLAAQEEWKKSLESNLWADNFLDAGKTIAAVTEAAAEVDALVGMLGLRKPR